MTWTLKPYAALTLDELYSVLTLRQRVFVVEQSCPYVDCDGYDHKATHLWHAGDGGEVDAYLRLFGPGVKYAECSLGRVVTAPEARRTGLGRELVKRGLEAVEALHPGGAVRISAQAYLERFYRDFGFAREGGDYLEDGIPHCEMLRAGR